MNLTVGPILTDAQARAVSGWRYQGRYSIYDGDPQGVERLLDPTNRYHGVTGEDHSQLIGFCCFGPDARVPGFAYDEDALDIGAGLRPDLTGRGLGAQLVEKALAFAAVEFSPTRYRVTVACFNERALTMAGRCGFHVHARFRSPANREFAVMIKTEPTRT